MPRPARVAQLRRMIQAGGFSYDPTRPVDMHVHIVGDGSTGSGCILHGGGWAHRMLYKFMEGHIGLPRGSMNGDLDRALEEKLAECAAKSSLGGCAVLAQDHVYDSRGRRMSDRGSYYVPNEYVFGVCRRHPKLLPVASIHPARPDAMEELNRCIDAGAVMLKLLPNCNNVDCNDRKYTKFWERMAEVGMPLLAHTGGEHTLDIVNARLGNPRVVTLPLDVGMTVIAAHSAGKSGLHDPEYFPVLCKMMRKYPNLHADQSALNIPLRSRLFAKLKRGIAAERLVHGSDFPVPVFGVWAWMRGHIDWKTCSRWQRHPNLLERDLRLKMAIGLPRESFTRGWKLLRLPHTPKGS